MRLTRVASLGIACTIFASTLAHVKLVSPLRPGVYDVTQMNSWTAGEAQTIRFVGSAVHGGGSCQFSLSEDLQPTKNSRWKVIHSVVGGCPATAEENLLGGPASPIPDTFEVVLPKELPSGTYTFAWTWFNKKGNREIYMNCAPISVRGGGTDPGFLASLPDMFIANLPSSACSTIENFDFAFPDPGSAVQTGSQARPTTGLLGSGCASMTALGGELQAPRPADALSNNSPSQASALTVLHEQPTYSASETASLNWFSRAPVKALAAGGMPASEAKAFVAQATQALASQGSTPPTGVAGSLPAASQTCIPCSPANEVVCIGSYHYGLCDHGCARSQLLAPGTVCAGGQILKRMV
ncbi:hypothetical protein COCSADRAFT_355596 [Bipolaris sorokiniana ND90Pr]|uniref:Lytic polysaccharide monooxygenase n=1 Tax=Cochliobolus sativus (strain ND90Pr / ATCC 201652) TaxID=665912 RepID=M2TB08_COCSN|nr:uncharacterized protein COCSADRAFT_355596 [Bipolaris sorokiniana ND90Pr]EMD66052.1 hypothetical protein COCSADRAFT_355596 [Bipolaris sorokiniana ND90Pr]